MMRKSLTFCNQYSTPVSYSPRRVLPVLDAILEGYILQGDVQATSWLYGLERNLMITITGGITEGCLRQDFSQVINNFNMDQAVTLVSAVGHVMELSLDDLMKKIMADSV